MKFYCIADEDTARGFRLAGVSTQVISTSEEACNVIDQIAVRPDCGIIIVTEKVAAWARPQIEAIRQERVCPLIVEIPGPEGPSAERKSLHQLVQEAVGVSVG
jgi:vacuolar-type H+-ATPase subunit F/Vma7